jgi:AraC-like DNA-binding protein
VPARATAQPGDDLATSEVRTARPAPPLQPFVDSYRGYRLTGFPAGVHRGLPSRHLTFIVSIGEPIEVVRQPDERHPPGRYGFVVGGLQAAPALIAHDGDQEGIAVELTPLGCRALLGVPARALWSLSLDADELLGGVAGRLRERLHATSGWDARFAVCDELLAPLVVPHRVAAPEVGEAWRLVVASGGTIPVAAVAAEVGWSRRHLAHRFTDELGLSPKLAARVVRFERARLLLQSGRRPALAEVAARCGYYDQPHLNRDFVELAGCPPGEWLATELPSVQDGGGADGAGSGA